MPARATTRQKITAMQKYESRSARMRFDVVDNMSPKSLEKEGQSGIKATQSCLKPSSQDGRSVQIASQVISGPRRSGKTSSGFARNHDYLASIMDLSRLRNALNDPKRKGDVDLQASFRSSALHLTQFLKTAQLGQEKAYQQGYADALSDVLGVIQAGLDGPTKGISEVIDWIDARQEALAADSSEAEIDDDPPAPSQTQEEPIASTSQPSPPTPQHPPTSTFNFSCPLPSTSSIPSSSTASPSVEPTPITRLAKHKMRKHLKSRANSHNAERDASGAGSAADEGQEGESRAGRKRTYEDDPMALFEEHVRPAKRVARR